MQGLNSRRQSELKVTLSQERVRRPKHTSTVNERSRRVEANGEDGTLGRMEWRLRSGGS